MGKYKVLLFDLDDTIFDFRKGEINSISYIFDKYGVEKTLDNINLYININVKYWEKLERKEMTKKEILEGRFKEFFETIHGPVIDPEIVNKEFLDYLSHEAYYMDDALEVLSELKKRNYKIFIISNGISYVQEGRLKVRPELLNYVDEYFVSDNIGYEKPDIRFMEYVLNKTKVNKDECLIIGDSLTSDMKLGFNSNINTIWFNARNKKYDGDRPLKEINKLKDLLDIL